MYKYILFDFDGTIVDSDEMVSKVFSELCARHQIAGITSRDVKRQRQLPFVKRLKLLLTVNKLKPEFQSGYYQNLATLRAFGHMLELLVQLDDAGYSLAILTSNNRENVLRFFELNHITISMEVLSSKGFFGKHRCLEQFMKAHGCDKKEMLYVGDEQRDIVACNRAGVDIAFVTWGYDGSEDVSTLKPRYTVSSAPELKNLLL